MRRREFITLLGGAAAAWPLAARAQQAARVPVIGYLEPVSPEAGRGNVIALRRALADAGYVDGKDITIEFRWGRGNQTLAALAAELVELRPAVIIAGGAVGSVLAAKAATSTIPIVMAGGPDPVKYRLVESLSRPGGNITGVTSLLNELAGKRLSLLRDMVPQAIRFGYLTNDPRGNEVEEGNTSEMIAAAHSLGREVVVAECRGVGDFEPAFATLVERGASALVVSAFPLAFNNRGRILALAARHKLPAIYPQPSYAFGGGLMSYSAVGTLYQAGFYYVPRILKGEKPADLPVQQPTRFEFVINLGTARALGIEVPPMLLAIADAVIE